MKKNVKKVHRSATTGEKIFQIINLVAIIAVLGFYTYRAYNYKAYFEKLRDSQAPVEATLSTALKERTMGDMNVFSDEEGNYQYLDKPENNYVLYSGRLFRVLEIYDTNVVKMVAEDVQGVNVINNYDSFELTPLYKWLNIDEETPNTGIFEKTLYNSNSILQSGIFCADKINDATSIACKVDSPEVRITLLTLEDYLSTGGANGFLNNGQEYWLASSNDSNEYWYVTADGNLSVSDFDTQLIGVRPVIFIAYDVLVSSGTGTAEDPFVIKGEVVAPETVSQLYSGKYVSYSNQTWKVVNVDEEGNAELILEGYLSNEAGEPVTLTYDNAGYYGSDSGIGRYLNNTYLVSLDRYESFLTSHTWKYGDLNYLKEFDYFSSLNKTADCYVGLPGIATMYNNGYNGIYLSSYDTHSDNTVYTIDDNGRLFGDFEWIGYKVRPLVAMKGDVKIVSGKGTAQDPYMVEVSE